ncbi:MAG: hypothetical protein QXD03_05490, partial [Candidatus Anstonellales archaeon]
MKKKLLMYTVIVVSIVFLVMGIYSKVFLNKSKNTLADKFEVKGSGLLGKDADKSSYKLNETDVKSFLSQDSFFRQFNLKENNTNLVRFKRSINYSGGEVGNEISINLVYTDKFDKPTSLSFVYNYNSEDNRNKAIDSISKLVESQFNANISKHVIDNISKTTIKDTKVVKEGNPYTIVYSNDGSKVLKLISTDLHVEGSNQLSIILDYDKTADVGVELNEIKDKINYKFNVIKGLEGTDIVNVSSKYASYIKGSISGRLLNYIESDKLNSLTMRVKFPDDIVTDVNFTLSNDMFSMETCTPMLNNVDEVGGILKDILKKTLGYDLEYADYEILNGVIDRDNVDIQIGDKNYKCKVSIQ